MIGTMVSIPIIISSLNFTLQAPPGTIICTCIIGNTAEEGDGMYFEGNSKLYIQRGPTTSEVTGN